MEQISGYHLKQLRLHYKGKQKETAEQLKIPQLELKSWEKEDFVPDGEKIRDYIVVGLGVDFHQGMELIDKMSGENLQEIRPTIAHSQPEFQTGSREEPEGEIV